MRLLLFLFALLLGSAPLSAAMDCEEAQHLELKQAVTFSPQELAHFAATPPLRTLPVNTPPLTHQVGNSTRYRGMAVDLLCRISSDTGLRFEIDLAPGLTVAEKITLVQDGRADLFIPLSYNAKRAAKGHFTTSFYASHYVAIALKRRALNLASTAELANRHVGVVTGVALETILSELIPAPQLKRYPNSFDSGGLFEALRKGEIDLAVFNREFFVEQRYLRELFDLEIVHTLLEYPRHYSFYFGPAHSELVELFNRYLASAELGTALLKHREGERQLVKRYIDERKQRTWLWTGIALAILLSAAVLYALHRHRRLLRQLASSHQRIREQQTELQTANQELTRLSLTDPLTGLANRRQFDLSLEREHAHWQRSHQPLSLLMLDLDHFKQVNDHYGHPTGDQYLCALAEILRQHCNRATDLVSRHGGEEFVCLLPGTEPAEAARIAHNIRRALQALKLPNALASPPFLTVSIGVVSLKSSHPASIAELLTHADIMLYAAKDGGRNRVAAKTL